MTEHIPLVMPSWAESNASKMADNIKATVSFAREKGSGKLFWFDRYYRPDGEEVVHELYVRMLQEMGRASSWKSRIRDEITRAISGYPTPVLLDRPEVGKIVLENGVYDVWDNVFSPPNPTYLTNVHIPITFDPKAECPYWDKFLDSLFPVIGGREYLQDFIAICMVPYTKLQQYLVLHGPGSNGKGTFLRALRLVVGNENTCSTSLERLCSGNEFVSYELVGKLLCAAGDLKGERLPDVSLLKQIVGEDHITVVPKGKKGFDYYPFCRFIFGTNFDLVSNDNSEGFKRRTIIVPFTQRFGVGEEEVIENLSNPNELSGLFNVLVYRLNKILEENHISPSPAVVAAIDSWMNVPDVVEQWIKGNVELGDYEMDEEKYYLVFTTQNHPWSKHGHTHANTIAALRTIYPDVRYDGERKIYYGCKCNASYKGVGGR